MRLKAFCYPSVVQGQKTKAKILLAIAPAILIFALIRPIHNFKPEDYKVLIIASPLIAFGCLYFLGSWCDIVLHDDGLQIEFLWIQLYVPWTAISDIKYFGTKTIGYWIILTDSKHLTIFHIIYSLGVSPMSPSFHVHRALESRRDLISKIKSKLLDINSQVS